MLGDVCKPILVFSLATAEQKLSKSLYDDNPKKYFSNSHASRYIITHFVNLILTKYCEGIFMSFKFPQGFPVNYLWLMIHIQFESYNNVKTF